MFFCLICRVRSSFEKRVRLNLVMPGKKFTMGQHRKVHVSITSRYSCAYMIDTLHVILPEVCLKKMFFRHDYVWPHVPWVNQIFHLRGEFGNRQSRLDQTPHQGQS